MDKENQAAGCQFNYTHPVTLELPAPEVPNQTVRTHGLPLTHPQKAHTVPQRWLWSLALAGNMQIPAQPAECQVLQSCRTG